MKKIIPTLILFLSCHTLGAQTEVLTGVMRGKDYGVTYFLPQTELQLNIQVTKHTYTPGEFAIYADRYLRLDNVSVTPSVHWTLDAVDTRVIGVPDKKNVYFVKLKDKTSAPLMEITQDGIVRSINMPVESRKQKESAEAGQTRDEDTQVNPRDFLTQEILLAGSTTKMAELVAKEIYTIRESKNNLLRGEAENMPKDGTQLKLMLDNLTLQERALTEMFAGKNVEEKQMSTIRITPKEMKNAVAFRFSQRLGIVAENDLAGEPVYISLTDLKTVTPSTETTTKQLTGVAYNVPGRAHLTLFYRRQKLYDNEVPVTQFGTVEYLAAVLFNKKSTIRVLFDTSTGGLLKVEREE